MQNEKRNRPSVVNASRVPSKLKHASAFVSQRNSKEKTGIKRPVDKGKNKDDDEEYEPDNDDDSMDSGTMPEDDEYIPGGKSSQKGKSRTGRSEKTIRQRKSKSVRRGSLEWNSEEDACLKMYDSHAEYV